MSCRPRIGWSEDYGIARRRKLFLGTEFERGAMVQEDLFGLPLRTICCVSMGGSGITANVLTLLFCPAAFLSATSSILTYKVRRAKRWNNGNRVPITMSGFTKEQYIGVKQMPDLDATPQEGMVFHCEARLPFGWRVFDIWDLQGAFDQFLRQAARLIRLGSTFSSAAEELNKLSDPESIA
jgi:hypothetical protein